MQENITNKKLNKSLNHLLLQIIDKIKDLEEKKRMHKAVFVCASLFIFSIGSLYTSVVFLINKIKNSELWYLLNILIFNFKEVLFFWKEFGLALAESLPIFEIIFLLISIIVFALFVKEFKDKKIQILKFIKM